MEKETVVKECAGCGKVVDTLFCGVYISPLGKWESGKNCPMATHLVREVKEQKFVNPLKASKREAQGRG